MINKYIIPNKYGFSRYRDIASLELTKYSDGVIDKSNTTYKASNLSAEELTTLMEPSVKKKRKERETTLLGEFTEEQKEIVLTFLGYTIACAQYLNIRATSEYAKANEEARFEANQLCIELGRKKVNYLSFNLLDKSEGEVLRIKDKRTLKEILIAIEPILRKQANKEKMRNGKNKNSYRKKVLLSLVPLFMFLEKETYFKNKGKKDIAEWILSLIDSIVSEKYKNLNLDLISCIEILVDYTRKYKNEKFTMELV